MPLINITPAAIFSDLSAALGILNSSAAVDIVGVFDASTFSQVFVNARPMKAYVRETSKVMDHPIETGSIVSDHRIIMPNEILMQLVIPSQFYGSTYNEIKNLFNNASLLSVQTRAAVYGNMFIADMPHEEDADKFDIITLALHLKEVQFVTSSTIYAPVDPKNENTVSNGLVSPQAATGAGTIQIGQPTVPGAF